MDTLVQVYRDGEWFIAVDLATDVADQGKIKEEAISRLKIGLKEHYAVLLDMLKKDREFEVIKVNVPNNKSSSPLIA
ncbi:hypothetical protein ACKUB1_15770 [Methanospirillum stamsii]|uniref:HicB family protein n=1 Tax=Methanospirillum stamsii TaxID=1277351 RepID=A0A2V2MN36_9EURY|nr:hypothetical protein [Methanospirillum stamsii]PWR69482.1 hypothetical protein DLD82_18025 [Methanospirillum stamsii]